MFVLRYKTGTIYPYGNVKHDVSGEYVRHTWGGKDGSVGGTTKDLQRAKVYNTRAGAKLNWDSKFCDIIEVKIELA